MTPNMNGVSPWKKSWEDQEKCMNFTNLYLGDTLSLVRIEDVGCRCWSMWHRTTRTRKFFLVEQFHVFCCKISVIFKCVNLSPAYKTLVETKFYDLENPWNDTGLKPIHFFPLPQVPQFSWYLQSRVRFEFHDLRNPGNDAHLVLVHFSYV